MALATKLSIYCIIRLTQHIGWIKLIQLITDIARINSINSNDSIELNVLTESMELKELIPLFSWVSQHSYSGITRF